MTTSWRAIDVPAAPRLIDPVADKVKAEPLPPTNIPPAGSYGASDIRAAKYGLYAVQLRKWGRGLITAIEEREAAAAAIHTRQQAERAAALARLKDLQEAEE